MANQGNGKNLGRLESQSVDRQSRYLNPQTLGEAQTPFGAQFSTHRHASKSAPGVGL
jgi:hypothetical protein